MESYKPHNEKIIFNGKSVGLYNPLTQLVNTHKKIVILEE